MTSQLALAEADYLIPDGLGIDVELAFLDDLAAGTFMVDCLDRTDLSTARDIARRYRDLELGLSDVSLVVLAGRHRTTRIATFDERAFHHAPLGRFLHGAAGRLAVVRAIGVLAKKRRYETRDPRGQIRTSIPRYAAHLGSAMPRYAAYLGSGAMKSSPLSAKPSLLTATYGRCLSSRRSIR